MKLQAFPYVARLRANVLIIPALRRGCVMFENTHGVSQDSTRLRKVNSPESRDAKKVIG